MIESSQGCVVWLTGLPGSGKTTLARIVEAKLRDLGLQVEVLDGDEVRKNLSPELGFTKEDREMHARRVVYISKLLSRNGIITIVALISPYRASRQAAREAIGSNFIEVWVNASSETCKRRDPKGLYKKASQGHVSNLTGIADPYEPPHSPQLVVETEKESEASSSMRILEYLENKGYLRCQPQRVI